MKKTLCILVLLLVGFSNSIYAKELPKSLFGIPLFQKINKWDVTAFNFDEVVEKNGNKYRWYDITKENVPKPNSEFTRYNFVTNLNAEIVNIFGYNGGDSPNYNKSPSEYKCTKEKEILISNLSIFYSIDQFENVFLMQKGDTGITLRDRSYLEIKENNSSFDRFLEIECQYNFENYWLIVRLLSKKYHLDSMVNKEIVDFLDFNFLASDLTGF